MGGVRGMGEFWRFCCECARRGWRGSFATTNGKLSTVVGGALFVLGAFVLIGPQPALDWAHIWQWTLYGTGAFLVWWLIIIIARTLAAPYHMYQEAIAGKAAAEGRLAEYEAKPVLEIEFDPADRKSHIRQEPAIMQTDHGLDRVIRTIYLVKITNVCGKTIRQVRVYGRYAGSVNSTRPQRLSFFDGETDMTLHPGMSGYAEALAFFGNGIAAGDPVGEAMGPIEIVASGEDIHPTKRIFRINFSKDPVIFD